MSARTAPSVEWKSFAAKVANEKEIAEHYGCVAARIEPTMQSYTMGLATSLAATLCPIMTMWSSTPTSMRHMPKYRRRS